MQLTLEIPDQFIQGKNKSHIARQIKLYAAMLMFQSGQLSRGAACEFAGVDIHEFFSACKKHLINAILTPEVTPKPVSAQLKMIVADSSALVPLSLCDCFELLDTLLGEENTLGEHRRAARYRIEN